MSSFPYSLAVLLCSLSWPATALSQSQPQNIDLKGLIKPALKRLHEGELARESFTRHDEDYLLERIEYGQFLVEHSYLYDDVWINGLPYKRLLEQDGKPLTGRRLAAEQKLYDQAVAERTKLGYAERLKMRHARLLDTHVDIDLVLGEDYRLEELRTEMVGEQLTHVIQADPVAPLSASTSATDKRYRLWITDKDPMLVCYDYELLSDEPDVRSGTSGVLNYQLIEGIPMPWKTTFHGVVVRGKNNVVVDSKHTYTQYRRFQTSMTIQLSPEDPEGTRKPGSSPRP
jgi:hypothetical protein